MKTPRGRLTLMLLLPGILGCAGPRPVVTRQELRPPESPGGPYTLFVSVTNRGRGEGQADVIARLRSRATGRTEAQANEQVDLKPHETVPVALQLRPPAPGDYDATAEVHYPPD
jgi:hypothetical protein